MAGSSSSASSSGDHTFPTTQGVVSGVVGLGLVVLLMVLVGLDGWGLVELRLQLGLLIFGILTWALMLRPRVRLRAQRLELVNPFDQISVPLHLIDSVEVRSVLKVYVGQRKYVGTGVGRKTRSMVRPTTMGAPGGPFSLGARGVRGEVDLPPLGGETADLVEDWVNRAAADARRDVKRTGVPDAAVRRRPNLLLCVVGGVLAVAFVVTLFL